MTRLELQSSIGYLQRVQEMAKRRYEGDQTMHYELRSDMGYIMSYTGEVLRRLEHDLATMNAQADVLNKYFENKS